MCQPHFRQRSRAIIKYSSNLYNSQSIRIPFTCTYSLSKHAPCPYRHFILLDLMAYESSSQYGRFPGRFPSPTPSMASTTFGSSRGPVPIPRTPDSRTRASFGSVRAFSVGSTASTAIRQTPVLSETQDKGLSFRIPARQQHSQVFSTANSTFTFSPETRPPVNRNAASDPRYDRSTSRLGQSYGSPMRVDKRGRRRLSNALRSYGTPAVLNLSAASFADPGARQFEISSKTAQQVHDGLKARLRKNITPNSTKGVVYIVRDPTRPHLLKIGAAMNFSQRKQQIERECNLHLEVVYVSDELENYTRTEHLVHGDLLHLCWEHTCLGCNTDHREWHNVSEGLAIQTTKRWVRFMKEEQPYNRRGELKSIWIFLTHKRRPKISTYDHDSRWDCWTQMLRSPSLIDYYEQAFKFWKAHPIWWFLWDFSWQVSTVLSWAVTFLLSMNFLALCLFFISFCCTCLSVASKSKKGRGMYK
jgi:hypothetical protein